MLSGQVVRPGVGAWHADLAVEGSDPIAGAQTLSAEAGSALKGTVVRAEPEDGLLRVRLVGGAASLGKEAPARSFRGVALRTVIADTLSAVGESLSASSDASALGATVEAYQRPRRPASATVREWAARKGLAWRVLPDGTVWLGAATRADFVGEARVLRRDGERRSLLVALEDFSVGPEHTLDGLAVGCVVYAIRPDAMRAEVLYE